MEEKQKKSIFKRWWFWVIVIIIIIGALSNSGDKPDEVTQKPMEQTNTTEEVSQQKPVEQANTTQKTVQESHKQEQSKENIPKEYQSALKKAEIYANQMHMSKAALFDQLVSEYGEKFSEEAAKYAIENVKADWKENALKKAIIYQEQMSMSPSAIYDQLISEYGEKFTKEEAQYAIDNLPK